LNHLTVPIAMMASVESEYTPHTFVRCGAASASWDLEEAPSGRYGKRRSGN
jgi:hypothetical protein